MAEVKPKLNKMRKQKKIGGGGQPQKLGHGPRRKVLLGQKKRGKDQTAERSQWWHSAWEIS